MKKNINYSYLIVLSGLWFFTAAYSIDFLMKLGWFKFTDWIEAVFSPVVRLFLGGVV